MSRRRRGITRCPKTPPSYPSYLPSSSNGNRRGAEGWRDPGEGGEGGWNMAERRRGSWHHGERKASAIAGTGRIPESPLWPARCRAGSGGGAAAVADTARPRIRHSLAHHTCPGNSLQMATCCGTRGVHVCSPVASALSSETHSRVTRGEAGVWSVLVELRRLYFANCFKHLGPDVPAVPPGECLTEVSVLAKSPSTVVAGNFPCLLPVM